MNRPGQPPQRPPSLGPPTGLGGPFRGPYPSYGMPPRNAMTAYPGLPNHRAQNMVPQPSPGFVQQRTAGFPFGATLQQQTQQQLQQQHPQGPLQSHSQQQQPNQPPSSAHANLPPHLTPTATPNSGGNAGNNTAPSASSTSEVGLDPNDFPALGSTPAPTHATATSGNGNGSNGNGGSYASQAGTGVPLSGNGNGNGGGNGGVGGQGVGANLTRDFTADDFPALGGPTQQLQQPSSQQTSDGHPPGLNGLHNEPQRQQPQQQHPGLLNLGPRALPGMQSEAEKQRHLKLAAQAAWNSTGASQQASQPQQPSQSAVYPSSLQNGSQSLNAPPGFPQQAPPQGQAGAQPTFNGNANNESAPSSTAPAPVPAPQTPAQQVLMSAADRWGLLGLLAMIKSTDPDQALLAVGTDLGTMGLDMQQQGNLYSTFITPWADSSAAHSVEPDFTLPECYDVQPPPPGPSKAASFSDETLFFMFYSAPRDALQEVAAQELYNRNWRFHKDLRVWLTKESGTAPSQKVQGGEQGIYTFWDPDNWCKERKDMTVLYADLEEKSQAAFRPLVFHSNFEPCPLL
ncbi:hypothetical protein OF83DRAFT_1164717 [Amylostereum chailletii]|nr:hypothetical protein OF83DRAFT_1164717 [Amylostereum chailletii]